MKYRWSTALVFFALLSASSPAAATLRFFVVNAADNTVSVVDGDLDNEIEVLRVGPFPQGVAVRQEPPLLAVANSRGMSVTLIDPISLELVEEKIRVGNFPLGLAFSADGKLLYSAGYDSWTINTVDVDAREQVGEPISVPGRPRRILLSPDGERLFVAIYRHPGGVAVVDLASGTVEKTIPTGSFPTDFALSPDGKRLFVAAFQNDTITAIDVATLEAVETFDATVGNGLLIHPTRPLLYSVDTFEERVWIVDYERKQQIGEIAVGQDPAYSTITPDGRFLYIVNTSSGSVSKVDTETAKAVTRIAVGGEPTDIAYLDMGSGMPVRVAIPLGVVLVLALVALGTALRRRDAARRASA